ncbi:MAG: polysaccharide pyruvyl transferase family protein [Dissulfurispiraceae bacterium]
MKVLFVNDSTSNPNWGDRAAAISMKKMIVESGGNISGSITEDELSFSTFQNNIPGEKDGTQQSYFREKLKLFIPPLFSKIRQKLITATEDDDIVPKRWEDFNIKLKQLLTKKDLYSDLLTNIEQSDLLVIHGDGCMKGNGRIPRSELFLTYVARRHFKKPVIIVNHTADFDHPDLYRMANEVYPLFNDVVFREPISVEKCRAMCNGRFAPDSAFLFSPMSLQKWLPVAQRPTYFGVWPDTAEFDPAKPYICIGGSSIFSYSGKPVKLINEFTALVEHISSIYAGQIVITVSDIIDQEVLRPVAQNIGLPIIGLNIPVQQAIDIVGNAEIYIGGRWHQTIFALSGGTPIIPLTSKTFMMNAWEQMLGITTPTFDSLDLDSEKKAIGLQVLNILEQGSELRNKLSIWAEKKHEECWGNVMYLKNMHLHN